MILYNIIYNIQIFKNDIYNTYLKVFLDVAITNLVLHFECVQFIRPFFIYLLFFCTELCEKN